MAFELDLTALPQRFRELHMIEFCSWRMGRHASRDFVLHWPAGISGKPKIALAWRKETRAANPGTVFGVVYLPNPDDWGVVNVYMAAIAQTDAAWNERKKHGRRCRAGTPAAQAAC